MYKKDYQESNRDCLVGTMSIIEGSTGATGEDAPWLANERDILGALSFEYNSS